MFLDVQITYGPAFTGLIFTGGQLLLLPIFALQFLTYVRTDP